MKILFRIILFEISISAFADFHPFFIGQKHKGETEMCLKLFPDYVRHCTRNLHILIKKDQFCADYSASCFSQRANGFVEVEQQKQKQEEIPSEEMGEDEEAKNDEEEEVDNANEEEEEKRQLSSSTIMPKNLLNGTNANETANNLEPDELPPLDFSLRRPPPSPSQRLSRQYNANFCCRFHERFDCLCREDHQNIGSYGAVFCPTYSERCGLQLPDWKKNKIVDGQNCCKKGTNRQERIILTCKQIKLTC